MKFKSSPRLESATMKRRRDRSDGSDDDDGQLLSSLIKDLRSKRVFPTKSIDRSPKKSRNQIEEYNEGNEEKKGEIGENGDFNYDVPSIVQGNRAGLNAGPREEFENIVGIVNAVDSNGHAGLSHVDQENNGSSGVSKRAAVFDEERLQKTPPDPEIRNLRELSGNGGSNLAAGTRSSDGEKHKGLDANSKTRLMLKPCFKRKLFRAPGSFSYRRLLPYLVDIAGVEDDQSTKLDKGSDKSPTSNLDDLSAEHFHRDSGICLQNLPSSTPESSHGINPRSECPTDSTKSPVSIDKKRSFTEPCWKPSLGSPENQKFSDAYHDIVVEGSEMSKNFLICESPRVNKQMENGVVMEMSRPSPCKVQTMSSTNSDFLEINGDLAITQPGIERSMVKIGCGQLCIPHNQSHDGGLEFLKGKDYSNKAQLLCSEENVGKIMRHNLLDSDWGLGSNSIGCEDPRPNATTNKNKLNVRNKIVRDPLAQLKLFGNRSSISYKRMLPFIRDIVEENTRNYVPSGDSQFPKLQEGKTMELHPRVEDSSCHKNCMTTSDLNADVPLSPIKCSTSGKVGNVTPSDVTSELTAISQKLQSKQVLSDQLEIESCIPGPQSDMEMDPNVSSSTPTSTSRPESFHRERTELFQDKHSAIDPIGLELKRTDLEVPSPSKTPSLLLRKGILKKNPRGCRGLCSCLSCSSFRLHAEKSFEFSSTLMLDAEEVASDLMKELSYTRKMLEIAVDWINDESGDRVNQVKDACRKASEAETLAEERLSQMKYELDIHSRIPSSGGPSVKFAEDLERQ